MCENSTTSCGKIAQDCDKCDKCDNRIGIKILYMGRELIDELGNRYDRLLVIDRGDPPPSSKAKSAFWLCRCDCGNYTVVNGGDLRREKYRYLNYPLCYT